MAVIAISNVIEVTNDGSRRIFKLPETQPVLHATAWTRLFFDGNPVSPSSTYTRHASEATKATVDELRKLLTAEDAIVSLTKNMLVVDLPEEDAWNRALPEVIHAIAAAFFGIVENTYVNGIDAESARLAAIAHK